MIAYLALSVCLSSVAAHPEVYLQSQKGGENAHVHVKNFKLHVIIADEAPMNISQDEYDYDYGQLTMRPTKGPTTTVSLASQELDLTSDKPINVTIPSRPSKPSNSSASINKTLSSRADKLSKCAPGFYRDSKGHCRKINRTRVSD